MTEMGLSDYSAQYHSRESSYREKFKRLGRSLNWPSRNIKEGSIPSVWFVAKSTESESLYRFLYHATSRYVHFSPVELARRGWGKDGRLQVDSNVYEPLWAVFTLSWGARLFGYSLESSLAALESEGVSEPPDDSLSRAFEQINSIGRVPLVTPDELRWDSKT